MKMIVKKLKKLEDIFSNDLDYYINERNDIVFEDGSVITKDMKSFFNNRTKYKFYEICDNNTYDYKMNETEKYNIFGCYLYKKNWLVDDLTELLIPVEYINFD